MIINAFLALSPSCWCIIIFGIVYVIAVMIYVMIQFDLNYEKRNQCDFHYTLMFITLPAVIGFNQRFKPKSMPLRIFYGFIVLMMIILWQIVYFKGIRFIKVPVQRHQIATIEEMAKHDFQLSGSAEVKTLISFDERVSHFFIRVHILCVI